MKAILEFNLPDDRNEFLLAKKGADYYCVLIDIARILREHRKYGKPLEKVYEEIEEIMREIYLDEI